MTTDGRCDPTPLVSRALEQARAAQERVAHLWEMTPAQRLAAFYRHELTFGECLAWARRFPHEPPVAADGEWLFIACRTPEWAEADEPSARSTPTRGAER